MGEEECDISLGLGIGGGNFPLNRSHTKKKPPVRLEVLLQTRTLKEKIKRSTSAGEEDEEHLESRRLRSSSKIKTACDDEEENINGGARKKLRLTKEQSALLEDSFRVHDSLCPGQKEELAQQLNLQPRQVEVWFQNRRARTKLKQTEVDRDFLKKCCESLAEENRRLKEELMEMRLIKPASGSQFYVHLQKAARLTICSSCQKMACTEEKMSGSLSIIPDEPRLTKGFFMPC